MAEQTTFAGIGIGERFRRHGETFRKLRLVMAEGEDRCANLFLAETQVEGADDGEAAGNAS